MPHVSGILGAVEQVSACTSPTAPSFHLMFLVLPQYLTGKTHSQIIFHLAFRQISFAQLLPRKGHFMSLIAAIFFLCTASAADKCFRDQSAKTARTAWDVSAAQIYSRAEERFFNHPDPGIQPWLNLCCCLTC